MFSKSNKIKLKYYNPTFIVLYNKRRIIFRVNSLIHYTQKQNHYNFRISAYRFMDWMYTQHCSNAQAALNVYESFANSVKGTWQRPCVPGSFLGFRNLDSMLNPLTILAYGFRTTVKTKYAFHIALLGDRCRRSSPGAHLALFRQNELRIA